MAAPNREGALRHVEPSWITSPGYAETLGFDSSPKKKGTYSCSVCKRHSLGAADFSESQIKTAIAKAECSFTDRDVREGDAGMTSQLYITAKCTDCINAAQNNEMKLREEKKIKLAEQGLASLNAVENEKLNAMHKCTACGNELAASSFSRKMLTRKPDKRKCQKCVEKMLAAEANRKADIIKK
eukprot:GEMP01069634.1.p1 GENE.GEMP01069634.1~~GEMP01069634.1.p1  ORF type:complete len:184 (+),score=34.04 GEMP01069634.1:304-855(+)